MKPAKFPGFLLANILVALLVGYLLDSWLHTSPVFIVAGVLYAVIGSIILLVWHARQNNG
ncbi:AtpZ/AtpI family protein [Faecalibaculum rodentium]|jgi:F0F1-type ATP synthase assembly protein I|uniref:Uncharacterized protein n=1 Tax=Faecalibaculum rodentium TaxID=1702221 RepID=A0A140DTC8_9FIRM|nr:AtpZ/AtpI family protein [Faecalibaculum rodentium]AMK53905.1 hypothetical protein AALO17_07710 [Faecalibaculum rodentium]OLU46117.1 hypothetical protein BO223_02745 [Faecalibaculum rodentium]